MFDVNMHIENRKKNQYTFFTQKINIHKVYKNCI